MTGWVIDIAHLVMMVLTQGKRATERMVTSLLGFDRWNSLSEWSRG
jgi:hypothetical protein